MVKNQTPVKAVLQAISLKPIEEQLRLLAIYARTEKPASRRREFEKAFVEARRQQLVSEIAKHHRKRKKK